MKVIENALREGRTTLLEVESKKVLSSFGIPVVKEALVASLDQALAEAERIGYPVALKGYAGNLAHKSEFGVIELNVDDSDAVKASYKKLMNNGKIRLEGILVQKQVKGDIELIIGLKKDPTFGHVILFGLGGVFTEVLKDVSIRAVPLEKHDADEMVREIKGFKLLEGYRGKKGVNLKKLCEILMDVGSIPGKYPMIKELDINPLIVQNGVPICVDALMVLEA
jgi:succinyl-CoA synthetase beta subunit